MLELVSVVAIAIAGVGLPADAAHERFPALTELEALHADAPHDCYVGRDRCGELCMQFVLHGPDQRGCDRYPAHAPRLIPVRR